MVFVVSFEHFMTFRRTVTHGRDERDWEPGNVLIFGRVLRYSIPAEIGCPALLTYTVHFGNYGRVAYHIPPRVCEGQARIQGVGASPLERRCTTEDHY